MAFKGNYYNVFLQKCRPGAVNSKFFVGKDFLRNKWKYKLTVPFKHEMIGKHFTETLNKVELQINCVRINRAQPVNRFTDKERRCLMSIPNDIGFNSMNIISQNLHPLHIFFRNITLQ